MPSWRPRSTISSNSASRSASKNSTIKCLLRLKIFGRPLLPPKPHGAPKRDRNHSLRRQAQEAPGFEDKRFDVGEVHAKQEPAVQTDPVGKFPGGISRDARLATLNRHGARPAR